VDIQGTLVNINSGGAQPTKAMEADVPDPTDEDFAQAAEVIDPDHADDSKTGFKSTYE
jgi:hypothetical protein